MLRQFVQTARDIGNATNIEQETCYLGMDAVAGCVRRLLQHFGAEADFTCSLMRSWYESRDSISVRSVCFDSL